MSKFKNLWICPQCLSSNSNSELKCRCGYSLDINYLQDMRGDITPEEVFNTMQMFKGERVQILSDYLIKRFPESKEAKQAQQYLKEYMNSQFKQQEKTSKSIPKLMKCPTCSNAISVHATSCPKCGEPLTVEIINRAVKIASSEPLEQDEANYVKELKQEGPLASPFALSCLVVSLIGFWTPVVFVNFIVVVAVVLGIISLSRKENMKILAIIGILLSLYCFNAASDQMEEVSSKLRDAQYELEQLQEKFR